MTNPRNDVNVNSWNTIFILFKKLKVELELELEVVEFELELVLIELIELVELDVKIKNRICIIVITILESIYLRQCNIKPIIYNKLNT